MPSPRPGPSYRLHKQSGQAIVTITQPDGRRRCYTLGRYGSPESRAEYDRLIGPAKAARELPPPDPAVTVNELLLAFLTWAATYYRDPDGTPTSELKEIRYAVRPVRELYGTTPAADFGPKRLAAVRQKMVDAGWCRTLVNRRVDRVKRAFKWAAAEEMIPSSAYVAVGTLAGLKKGRSAARESEPVGPVDPAHVDATLPHLNRHTRAMVELQRLTGMRPGEVCRLSLAEVDRTADVWVYRPEKHKTAHRGKARAVMIGPKGRAVIEAFVAGGTVPDPAAPLFSPLLARRERFAAMRAARKSKVPPSQRDRTVANPKRRPATSYRVPVYANAVAGAAERAGVPHWHPNQLRHLYAAELRKSHTLEHVRAALGHSRAAMSDHYSRSADAALAGEVAAAIG